VTTIAYSEPPAIAANMSEISSLSSRSNCIRVPAGSAHNYIQFETLIDAGRKAGIRAERGRGGCCASWWTGASEFMCFVRNVAAACEIADISHKVPVAQEANRARPGDVSCGVEDARTSTSHG
jgi:hypothetical protein